MEVAVLDSEGLPCGSLLSVRFGGVRRQAPVDKVQTSALKFPCSMDSCCDPLKIEVLQPVAAGRLVLQHKEETYQVGLNSSGKNGKCLEPMRVALQVRSASSSSPPSRGDSASTNGRSKPTTLSSRPTTPIKYQDAAVSAREYLEVHGLLRYIQGLLHAVIQVRPEDPFQFMIQQLSAAVPKANGTPHTPPFVSEDSLQEKVTKPACNAVLEAYDAAKEHMGGGVSSPALVSTVDTNRNEAETGSREDAPVTSACDGSASASFETGGAASAEPGSGAQLQARPPDELPNRHSTAEPPAQAVQLDSHVEAIPQVMARLESRIGDAVGEASPAEQSFASASASRSTGPAPRPDMQSPAGMVLAYRSASPRDSEALPSERGSQMSLQEEAPRHHQHASGVAPPDHHNMASGPPGAEQTPRREDAAPDHHNLASGTEQTEQALEDLDGANRPAEVDPVVNNAPLDRDPRPEVVNHRSTSLPGPQAAAVRSSVLTQASADSLLRGAVSCNDLGQVVETPRLGEYRERLRRTLLSASASGMLDEALKRIVMPESPQIDPGEGVEAPMPPPVQQLPLEEPPAPKEAPPKLPPVQQLPLEEPPPPKAKLPHAHPAYNSGDVQRAHAEAAATASRGSVGDGSRAQRKRRGIVNSAFVFIKPHAVNDKVCMLVKEALMVNDINVRREGSMTADEYDIGPLIDRHYYSISSKASLLTPGQLNVPKDAFKSKFGVDWDKALESGRALNAKDACKEMGLDASAIAAKWSDAKKANKLIAFGGGCYCAQLEIEAKGTYYVFNGFFPAMRQKYITPGAAIHYMVVEWDYRRLSWADFREKVIGPADPAKAPRSSLRGTLFASWQEWGLHAEPDLGDNGLHASASPFEAFAERRNWLGQTAEKDPFGQMLLKTGISQEQLQEWSKDPQVATIQAQGLGPIFHDASLFQVFEDTDAEECLEKCRLIAFGSTEKTDTESLSSAPTKAREASPQRSPDSKQRQSLQGRPKQASRTQSKEMLSARSENRSEESKGGQSNESVSVVELRGIHDAIRELRSENVSLKKQVDTMATEMNDWKMECKHLTDKLEKL